ncbi:MAG: Asp23/Gls24 family envelope stress response protein [Atribacterota bacterium]|nr:Asp23/Gls24 family envelope stress response protein [Atribacterota bacterium]
MSILKGVEIASSQGKITYALRVLQKIVERTVLQHRGIESLEKNRDESIRIEARKGLITLNLFLIFNLERRAPEVAWELQRSLKEIIEKRTGIRVGQVNIYVQGFDSRKMERVPLLGIPG